MPSQVRAATIWMWVCALCAPVQCQQRVDPRSMYERLMAVVPIVGSGKSSEDPRRPLYAPTPAELRASAISRTGILGFTHVLSDDGHFALVEFVARDRSAFKAILADSTVKAFLKGRDKRADVEAEFKKYKKDFDFATYGVRMR